MVSPPHSEGRKRKVGRPCDENAHFRRSLEHGIRPERKEVMSKVLLEMSISLDGYIAGPDVDSESPMGRGGELLHEWMFDGRSAAEVHEFETEHFSSIGDGPKMRRLRRAP
jgi:hypothetical protein